MNRVALSLLASAVAPADREAILGDLEEEAAKQPRGWLWWQALRSIVPALRMRWRRGELQEPILVPVLLVMVPFRALDLLWTYVLSGVPLRASAERPIEFLVASLVVLALGSYVSGRLAPAAGMVSFALTVLCLATDSGPVPVWYATLALAASLTANLPRRIA